MKIYSCLFGRGVLILANKPTLKDILPQLRSWCKVNNVSVQSVYDRCHGMTLQELVYYLFGVVKQASEEVVDYEGQFKELYTYVHDYFDNLNVQDEVDTKLEQMLSDGTLSTLVQNLTKSNWLNGKSVVVYGDSTASIPTSPWNWIKNNVDYVAVTNRSIGGTILCNKDLGGTATALNNGYVLITSATDLSNFDYVAIQYGINDYASGLPLSSATHNDISTFKYALEKVLTKICEAGAIPIICTPIYSHISENTHNSVGAIILNYVDYLINIGLKYNAVIIDQYHLSGCNETNYQHWLTSGTEPIWNHPNEALGEIMALNILSKASSHYTPYKGTLLWMYGNSTIHRLGTNPDAMFNGNISHPSVGTDYQFPGLLFNASNDDIPCIKMYGTTNGRLNLKVNSETVYTVYNNNSSGTTYFEIYFNTTVSGRLYASGDFTELAYAFEVLKPNCGFAMQANWYTLADNVSTDGHIYFTHDSVIFKDFNIEINAAVPAGSRIITCDLQIDNQFIVTVCNSAGNYTASFVIDSNGVSTLNNLEVTTYYLSGRYMLY